MGQWLSASGLEFLGSAGVILSRFFCFFKKYVEI
jgi:hypothetical protein